MAVTAKGYVSLAIGGKDVKLRFDFNAIADAEEMLGKPVSHVFSEEGQGLGFNEIRTLLYAGSQGAFRSKREAGGAITPDNMTEVGQAIGDALQAAFGSPEESAEGE